MVVSTSTAPSSDDRSVPYPLHNGNTMDTFFKRHFRKKPTPPPSETFCPPTLRRCSVVITTGKARRRSSAGLASTTLSMQRRCSVTQAPALPLGSATPGRGGKRDGRRRSSTTTPGLSPRFAVQKRRQGKLHCIDRQLLGPSMLLASLIQMKKEPETKEENSDEEELEETSEEGTDQENHSPSSSAMSSSMEICDPQPCTTDQRKLYAGD